MKNDFEHPLRRMSRALKQNIWMKAAPQKHLHGFVLGSHVFLHLNTLIDKYQHIMNIVNILNIKTTDNARARTHAHIHTGRDTPTHS